MLRRVPVWDLVDKAVRAFGEQLPDDERKPLTQFSRRMSGE